MKLLVLCLLWLSWCTMHSLLIDPRVVLFVDRRLPWLVRPYRLIYNSMSLLTLVPLAMYTRSIDGNAVFAWQGWGVPLRILLLTAALVFFWAGAKRYDMQYFLGFRQLRTGENHLLLSDSPNFSEAGIFGMTRHPWYLGSLLLVWSALREYSLPIFAAAAILSAYLIVGTLLEERKILARYGIPYRLYQERVSMLFPWKWLKKKMQVKSASLRRP